MAIYKRFRPFVSICKNKITIKVFLKVLNYNVIKQDSLTNIFIRF